MQVCPSCSHTSPSRFRLCGNCGEELLPDRPREIRRQVTVFFSDLKGSTTMGEKLDSEALFEVLSHYFEAMRAPIEGHGGKIEKLIGDAILAVFGMPRAHVDDPLRAVQAAAECQAALAQINEELERTYGLQLTNRTGLATGEVVVGLPGPGEHVLTGDVLHHAMELEAAAPAMGVLMAESTRAVVGSAAQVRPMPLPASLEVEAGPDTELGTCAWELLGVDAARADAMAAQLGLLSQAGGRSAATVVPGTPDRRDPAEDVGAGGPLVTCDNCGELNPVEHRVCGTCGSVLGEEEAGSEIRKTVTVIFCDLRPSSAGPEPLAPDRVREIVSRGFADARTVVERHGGSVEKFIGDALVCVFGLPVLHEDDALRAARAALAIQDSVRALDAELAGEGVRLTARVGVNTGLVVAGNAVKGLHLVTGDAMNTAARLEQAAPDGGVLLGDSTYGLIRDAVEVEAVEPLRLKGKAEPVVAHRLVAAHGSEGRARRFSAPLVGRESELSGLLDVFHESVVQNGPRLVTVLGDAGLGKSRLVRQFEQVVGHDARVFRGRCLAYGESITFAPIVDVVRSAACILDDDTPAQAAERIRALVGDRRVADRLAAIAGLTDTPFPLVELYWGVRRLVEQLAAERPLMLVMDGVHWAEPALLDLLEHLLSATSELPLLVVCLARHELLENREEWAPGLRGRRLVLSPLEEEDGRKVVDDLLGPGHGAAELRDRVVAAAHGNPLFMEQLVSKLVDDRVLRFEAGRWIQAVETGEIALPATIQALLAARVDALPRDERGVVQPAAVVGYEFGRSAVDALVEDEVRPRIDEGLSSLTVRQFVRPDPDLSADEDGYRFRNQLIRDAAYQGLLKRARVALHERYVAWADEVSRERGRELEFEEILGYHLEQAYRYRTEFGPPDEAATAIGRDAARRLASAGRRAFLRGDMSAASGLLGRSVAVLPGRDPDRLVLLPELGEALLELGDFDRADEVLVGAMRDAGDAGDEATAANARLVQSLLRFYQGGDADGWSAGARTLAEESIAIFERLQDHAGLTRSWRTLFGVNAMAGRYGPAADAAERVLDHARRAGDSRQEARGATAYAQAALLGPVPVDEAIGRCEDILGRVQGDRRTEALVLLAIAEMEGMKGSFDVARGHYARARSMLAELGRSMFPTSPHAWRIETLAGDLPAAERELRRDFAMLDAMGERFILSGLAAELGRTRLDQGDAAEAAILADRARDLSDADDVDSQALWRSLLARVLLVQGDHDEAVEMARSALAITEASDSPMLRADVLVDLGEILGSTAGPSAARAPLEEALSLYEAKGCTVAAAQVAARLSSGGSSRGRKRQKP